MDVGVFARLAALPEDATATLALLVGVEGSAYRRPGAARLLLAGGAVEGLISGGCLERELAEVPPATRGRLLRYDLRAGDRDPWGWGAGCAGTLAIWLQPIPARAPSPYRQAARWIQEGHSAQVVTVLDSGEQWARCETDSGLTCGTARPLAPGERVFVDQRQPPPGLAIFGWGPDADVLVEFAERLGFGVLRPARHTPPAEALAGRAPAAAIVMGHHLDADRAALTAALAAGVAYVGVLGPRARTERILHPPWPPTLHAPVGLDLGADGPEEVALAILAEVVAVRQGGHAGFLRDRAGPIHPRAACTLAALGAAGG